MYIALVEFHPGLLPERLLNIILTRRQEVPFSTAAEALGLLIAFELLQESGVHLPQAIGQSVSTIGGIVVGTAAVEAGLISPVVLIVVSIAGVLAAFFGFWGIAAGLIGIFWHLSTIRCLGVPYLQWSPAGRGILRKRLKHQKRRDDRLHPKDRKNQQ